MYNIQPLEADSDGHACFISYRPNWPLLPPANIACEALGLGGHQERGDWQPQPRVVRRGDQRSLRIKSERIAENLNLALFYGRPGRDHRSRRHDVRRH